jgi:hypothetical protein
MLAVGLLAGLGGCDGHGGGDTSVLGHTGLGTPGTAPSAPSVATYVPDCIDAATYHGVLTTIGLTSGLAVLDLWDTASATGASEEHDLLSTSIDENGASETLEVTLTATDDPAAIGDYGDGTGLTQFSCDAGREFLDGTSLTYAIRIYDLDHALADCEAFGADPSAVASGTYPTAGGQPSAPGELVQCRIAAGP